MASLVGVGLRPTHYPFLETQTPGTANWFEAISENYMDSHGRPRQMLRHIRRDFPIALHGVSMSLASCEGLDKTYLERLRSLVDEIDPIIVSDHLCWTGHKASNIHDLLPFPFTHESMDQVVSNLDQAQNALGRTMLIENISAYIMFEGNDFSESDFLIEVAKRSGTKLLLDINNIYVNAVNFDYSPSDFINSIPTSLIGQIHLAGFSDVGDFLFDTHSMPVYSKVWDLFSHLAPRLSSVPVLIEWDEDIPEFHILEAEAQKAKSILEKHNATQLSVSL